MENKLLGAAKAQSEQAAAVADAVQVRLTRALTELGEKQTDSFLRLQDRVAKELGQVRADSEAKLEQIRATVDEKLHSTLKKRLGETPSDWSVSASSRCTRDWGRCRPWRVE